MKFFLNSKDKAPVGFFACSWDEGFELNISVEIPFLFPFPFPLVVVGLYENLSLKLGNLVTPSGLETGDESNTEAARGDESGTCTLEDCFFLGVSSMITLLSSLSD